jgi:hypothetical protein
MYLLLHSILSDIEDSYTEIAVIHINAATMRTLPYPNGSSVIEEAERDRTVCPL